VTDDRGYRTRQSYRRARRCARLALGRARLAHVLPAVVMGLVRASTELFPGLESRHGVLVPACSAGHNLGTLNPEPVILSSFCGLNVGHRARSLFYYRATCSLLRG